MARLVVQKLSPSWAIDSHREKGGRAISYFYFDGHLSHSFNH